MKPDPATSCSRASLSTHLKIMLKGMAMGTADIIPGVSGGTMAYILGIYARLLAAIAAVNAPWLANLARGRILTCIRALDWELILPLGAGIVSAVILMTKVIPLPELLQTDPEPVYGLFFGLIAGSIWVLLAKLGLASLRAQGALWVVAGVVIGVGIVTLTPTETPDDSWFIFFCGALAISAMLLPGISGSFILLLLGKYATILTALSTLNVSIIIPFAAGCAVGLAAFSRVIGWLMRRYERRMTQLIGGILIGTLYIIWPFQQRQYVTVRDKERLISSHPILPETLDAEALLSFALLAAGVAAVVLMQRLAQAK